MKKNHRAILNNHTFVRIDCKWFKSNVPCVPHKKNGCFCIKCRMYEPLGKRILIIKLGAAGDVIRTTPLLRRIRKDYPDAEISWLTYFPDLVPKQWVNKILDYKLQNVEWLKAQKFDWLINLDKDDEAIGLAEIIYAKKKSGFGMGPYGKCRPFGNKHEKAKWLTGLWDDLNRVNKKNYMEEIFEICGYSFRGEEYILECEGNHQWRGIGKNRKVVGLNTGCGGRWKTRLWGESRWVELAKKLKRNGYEVILLGGPNEDSLNKEIAKKADLKYLGFFNLPIFIDLMNQCEVIVTQVTMALHIAIALKKKVVLINNIFNKNEFDLYGKGEIIQPDLKCLGCFKQRFDKKCPVGNCMDLIKPEIVFEKII
jgi:ADP-heptose:LPS heptosyltransferase